MAPVYFGRSPIKFEEVNHVQKSFSCSSVCASACFAGYRLPEYGHSDEQHIRFRESGKVDLSQKREIGITITTNSFITDYEDNDLTKQIEEDLNCNITFNLLPAGTDALSKLQLMINGGDELTDVVSYNLSSALRYQYGSGGTFIPLNSYFDNKELMPYYNAIESEEDKASMQGDVMSADGNIYCLSRWTPEFWDMTPYRIYMNMKWLENLNLDVPTNSDELKDVLVAFANDDPNGNGVKDEIPVFTQYTDGGGYGCNIILALINMFQYTGTTMSGFTLSDDGKTVIAPQATEGWQEAMKYLNSLYKEGALIDNSFVYDSTAYKGTLNYQGIGTEAADPGKSINIVGMFTAGSNSGNFVNSGKDENVNYLEYQMIPVPEGTSGKAYAPYSAPSAVGFWYVTSDAEDPDFCVKMGDWFYETKHSMWVRYGLEEVDWTMDEKVCSDWYTEHTKLIEGEGYEQPIDDYYSIVRLRADALWAKTTPFSGTMNSPAMLPLISLLMQQTGMIPKPLFTTMATMVVCPTFRENTTTRSIRSMFFRFCLTQMMNSPQSRKFRSPILKSSPIGPCALSLVKGRRKGLAGISGCP